MAPGAWLRGYVFGLGVVEMRSLTLGVAADGLLRVRLSEYSERLRAPGESPGSCFEEVGYAGTSSGWSWPG